MRGGLELTEPCGPADSQKDLCAHILAFPSSRNSRQRPLTTACAATTSGVSFWDPAAAASIVARRGVSKGERMAFYGRCLRLRFRESNTRFTFIDFMALVVMASMEEDGGVWSGRK